MKSCALTLLIPCVLLVACARKEAPPTSTPAAFSPTAQATLAGAPGSAVTGNLQLVATADGVTITGKVQGLAPGTEHGFHVHQIGKCSKPDFASAGEHFNPMGAQHGNPAAGAHHLGDTPNIMADAAGNATIEATIAGATLRDGGPHDLFGRALVVHAKRDDYSTQPSGGSGERLACGVIRPDRQGRDS